MSSPLRVSSTNSPGTVAQAACLPAGEETVPAKPRGLVARLCDQAVESLDELVQAFGRADEAAAGRLLIGWREKCRALREGLASVVLRLCFLLHAEARGLAPLQLGPLFAELRSQGMQALDEGRSAWPRLLAILLAAAERGAAPPGSLFGPERHPFLGAAATLIPDRAVLRVLELLLVVEGEPVRYEELEVESLGAVFETLLDFELVRVSGTSVALRPDHAVLDLEALLADRPERRAERVAEISSPLASAAAAALAAAGSIEAIVAVLGRRLSPRTPAPVPGGSLLLQPGPERRRSGAHFTPRALTGPIVREALAPLLEQLGESPDPERLLALKLCDPAMGSGAFLLEACRQLGEVSDGALARGRIARRCLYGVDRNPGAVEAARLSLWLLAADPLLPLGFLDHALRAGDALVGLGSEQLAALHWEPERCPPVARAALAQATGRAAELRSGRVGEDPAAQLESERATAPLRAAGDLVVGTFFEHGDAKARRAALKGLDALESQAAARAEELCARHGLRPFHWGLEFPEVFAREAPGFDLLLGNPPFLGGSAISSSFGGGYRDWLLQAHPGSHGNADLCAHFLRRAWGLLSEGGALGMITTKTIAEGDTRASALQPILASGGTLRAAVRNLPWPGAAVVAVSVLQLTKGSDDGPKRLDGEPVAQINSRLRPKAERPDPVRLRENAGRCYLGSKLYGEGFVVSPEEREALIAADPANAERIRPYLGGEEVNRSPTQTFSRYAIDFGELSLEEAGRWPMLLERVRERVKPERDLNRRDTRRIHWWRFGETCPALYSALRGMERCLVTPRVTKHLAFSLQPTGRVFNEKLNVFGFADFARFGVLQSRVHEAWVRLLSSTIGIGQLNYSGSDCFDTFPFPDEAALDGAAAVARAGEQLHRARAALMLEGGFGLTESYNRLADPACEEAAVAGLRELHRELDRAVCEAYGWRGLEIPRFEEPTSDAERRALAAFDDEVIDRLFALNAERAAREPTGAKRRAPRRAARKGRDEGSGWLF